MAIQGDFTNTETGATYTAAFARVYPVQLQAIGNAFARFTLQIFINQTAADGGKLPVNAQEFVIEGADFQAAFLLVGTQVNANTTDQSTDAETAQAISDAIVYAAEDYILSLPDFTGWSRV